jgi:hypothetical protein
MIYQLDIREKRQLEKMILKRVEEIVFGTKRPSGRQKIKGGLEITDDSGELRRTIRANKDFITQNTSGGLEIGIEVTDYFQYLDDARRDELNWYISEGVFLDNKINEILEGALSKMVINATIEFLQK